MDEHDRFMDDVMELLEKASAVRVKWPTSPPEELTRYEVLWESIAMWFDDQSEEDLLAFIGLMVATGQMDSDEAELLRLLDSARTWRRVRRKVNGETYASEGVIKGTERRYRSERRAGCLHVLRKQPRSEE